MAADGRRQILRFFGPRGDLLAAEAPGLVVYDSFGRQRMRAEVDGFLDLAAVGEELWAVTPRELVRLHQSDGREIAREPLDYVDPSGRFMQSSTAPQLPVWHAPQPVVIRSKPARTETPGSGGQLILPIAEGRWLLWHNGQLRSWRSIGEAWRRQIGDPGWRAVDAQLVLDGRLFVLATRRGDDAGEMKLTVVATNDGAPTTQLRIDAVSQLAFATRRGIAVVRTGDRLSLIDLRFGRWLRDLALPAGVTGIAVDEGLQRIALAIGDRLELVRPDALASPVKEDDADVIVASDAPSNGAGTNGDEHAPAVAIEPPGTTPGYARASALDDARTPAFDDIRPSGLADVRTSGLDDVRASGLDDVRASSGLSSAENEALPAAPLVRLVPVTVKPTATPDEIRYAIDVRLQWIGARCAVAIAAAWDQGRIVRPDAARPPFAHEVAGLLGIQSGLAPEDIAGAAANLAATEQLLDATDAARAARLLPIDVLQRDFGLSDLAVDILFAIAGPRLRGELARVYGILANDPSRPLVDEHLLGLILGQHVAEERRRGHRRDVGAGEDRARSGGEVPAGEHRGRAERLTDAIARALDVDRPLRRFGLVHVGTGEGGANFAIGFTVSK